MRCPKCDGKKVIAEEYEHCKRNGYRVYSTHMLCPACHGTGEVPEEKEEDKMDASMINAAIRSLQTTALAIRAGLDDGEEAEVREAITLLSLANGIGVDRAIATLTAAQPLGDAAVPVLEAAGKVEWKPDDGVTTILTRFDEAVDPALRQASQFKNDWIWQERRRATEIARALLASLPVPK